jgi:COP9 signalosome complex subunit 5
MQVMGMLQGKVINNMFIIVDTFALPVEGTETRVNAAEGAYEFLTTYPETAKVSSDKVPCGTEGCLGCLLRTQLHHRRAFVVQAVGRYENIVGWYHSHPGYGCWLSGIDCQTQMIYQTHQDPWLAIVVDPHRTMSAGMLLFLTHIYCSCTVLPW